MDIPDLVKGALGDEEIQAGVSLGDEDAVCLTPTRTLVYRGEGLLSDEQVEEYSHDIEALAVSEGRRKTKFTMQYIDGTESFTVPANRGDKVLGLFLEGVLRLDGVIDPRESVAGVYRFSELTLIITEGRLIKHIGNQVWTEDFEVYDYDDVTGLEFERASVATSIALTVNGRPQRVKVPNDKAPVVRQTLEEALFGYYEVGSIDELNRVVGGDDAVGAGGVGSTDAGDDGFAFGDDFDPLVSDEDEDLIEPVEGDRPDRGAAAGEPGGAQQPTHGGESTDRPQEPAPDRSADRSTDAPSNRPDENAEPTANAPSGTDEDPGHSGDSEANTPEQPRSTGPGQQPSEPAQQRSESGQQQSEPDQQPSEPAQQRSASTERQQSASADSPSPEAATGNATASTPDGQRGGEGRTERSAQSSASRATESQSSAGGSDRSTERETGEQSASTAATGADDSTGEPISREDYEALAERVEELTDAVDRQNELLKRQHRALKQLVQRDQQSE